MRKILNLSIFFSCTDRRFCPLRSAFEANQSSCEPIEHCRIEAATRLVPAVFDWFTLELKDRKAPIVAVS
jgi:hypothetical protein